MGRKQIVKGRLYVAIPFRTEAERDKFMRDVEALEDKTIGEFILELIREYQRQEQP